MISLEPNHEDKYVDLYTVNSRCVCLSIIVTSLSLDAGTLELALLSHMKVGGSWYTKCNLFRKLDFEVKFFFVLQVVFLWFISFKMMEWNKILLMWQVLFFSLLQAAVDLVPTEIRLPWQRGTPAFLHF